MFDEELFQSNPRSYAIQLVEEGFDKDTMILALLKYMSHDDVRGALDANMLSPRFDEEQGQVYIIIITTETEAQRQALLDHLEELETNFSFEVKTEEAS